MCLFVMKRRASVEAQTKNAAAVVAMWGGLLTYAQYSGSSDQNHVMMVPPVLICSVGSLRYSPIYTNGCVNLKKISSQSENFRDISKG